MGSKVTGYVVTSLSVTFDRGAALLDDVEVGLMAQEDVAPKAIALRLLYSCNCLNHWYPTHVAPGWEIRGLKVDSSLAWAWTWTGRVYQDEYTRAPEPGRIITI